jgi:predicted nucleic acid-binding protein
MSNLVVDASVAVKWLIQEPLSDKAIAVLARPEALIAPDLLVAEVANVLWKKVRSGELTEIVALERFAALRSMGLDLRPSPPLAARALSFAIEAKRTVYDALYLALAEQEDCLFVTADERFVNALMHMKEGKRAVWLGTF